MILLNVFALGTVGCWYCVGDNDLLRHNVWFIYIFVTRTVYTVFNCIIWLVVMSYVVFPKLLGSMFFWNFFCIMLYFCCIVSHCIWSNLKSIMLKESQCYWISKETFSFYSSTGLWSLSEFDCGFFSAAN